MTGRSGHSAFQGKEEGSGPDIHGPVVDSNIFQRMMDDFSLATQSWAIQFMGDPGPSRSCHTGSLLLKHLLGTLSYRLAVILQCTISHRVLLTDGSRHFEIVPDCHDLEAAVAMCRHGRHIGQDPCVLRAQQFVSSSVWSKAMRDRLHESLC